MWKTTSNLCVLSGRQWRGVWMALVVLTSMCLSVVSVAQQTTSAGTASSETSSMGELVWMFNTESRPRSFSHGHLGPTSAAITEKSVYFGSFDGYLYAVDRHTGQERWRFQTGDSVFALPPSIADGVIYFGSFDHHLYAVDIETGQEQWRFETGDKVDSSPAIVDGVAYFGSRDGNFYAVDCETGQEQW